MKPFLLVLLFVFSPLRTFCCDCDPQFFIGLEEAGNVFTGKVESIRKVTTEGIRYEVTFVVDEWKKGPSKTERFTVNLDCLNESCCGFEFDWNSSYEVYTYEHDGRAYTGFCTSTHKIS